MHYHTLLASDWFALRLAKTVQLYLECFPTRYRCLTLRYWGTTGMQVKGLQIMLIYVLRQTSLGIAKVLPWKWCQTTESSHYSQAAKCKPSRAKILPDIRSDSPVTCQGLPAKWCWPASESSLICQGLP